MSERSRFTQIPGTNSMSAAVASQTGGGSTAYDVVFPNEWEASVVVNGAYYVPNSAVTASRTDNFAIQLINVGAAGSGTTAVTSALTINLTQGNLVALKPVALTVSTTAANLVVASGSVLVLKKTENGSGLTMPAGKVVVTYQFV